MNIVKITSPDICNGNGVRVTMWVSGCKHNCPECHNAWLQNYSLGKPLSEVENSIIERLNHDYIDGLTVSGGDPLYQSAESLQELSVFLKKVKETYPDKNIWLYTGFTMGQINEKCIDFKCLLDVINCVDYIVDGKFELDKKNADIAFRGSTNQRILKIENGVYSVVSDSVFKN